ncbi:MAG TPA: pantetheine-phosphate adenylyltransferase [Elusimicrobia bacterium]|nr:MAG: pantetheine-phosphate adenylyltransferase [Elusimicrobia bacterium GWA2_64_40]OGR67735.1 MAG: pantetheine-phosphate adenylyltransferase [Elusimicrobia bacterium GWB2_63_16]HAN04038.1 pantetheine-phosphate adenylyltransferase [Elusimicrobiota bacterium]HAU89551.1 pantetheine-phosphate adenylyltransferase [Elusimicrobiota bacterium]
MKKRVAVYPGSFDPVTFGHLDIIDRAAKIFDHLIVSVFVHSAKRHLFEVPERVAMLKTALKGKKNVSVDCFEGLLVDYAKKKKTEVIVRGLRAISDLEYEFQIAAVNRTLSPGIETVFFMPRQRYTYLSSSIVRDIAHFKGDVSKLVPPHVVKAIKRLKK